MKTDIDIYKYLPYEMEVATFEKIEGGISNQLYHIKTNDKKEYVLRIFEKNSDNIFKISREQEITIQSLMEHSNMSPKVINADLEKGAMLIEYVNSPTLKINQLIYSAEIRKELIRSVVYFHRQKYPTTLKKLNIIERTLEYKEQLKNIPEELTEVELFIGSFQDLYSKETNIPTVLCHNDLTFNNILNTENMMFIDYEYAAPGNPIVDLAGLCESNELNEQYSRLLWRLYYQKANIYNTTKLPPLEYDEYFRAVRILLLYMSYVWYLLFIEKLNNAEISGATKKTYELGRDKCLERLHDHRNQWIKYNKSKKNHKAKKITTKIKTILIILFITFVCLILKYTIFTPIM